MASVNSRDGSNQFAQFAYKVLLSRSAILGTVVMFVVIVGVFCGWGPLGTHAKLTVWQRFGHCLLFTVVGLPIGYSIRVVTLYFCRGQSPLPVALALIASSLYVSLPVTAVVYTVEMLTLPHFPDFVGIQHRYVPK